MGKPILSEQAAWDEIANANDQVAAYYRWCRVILKAYKAKQVAQGDAASMMLYPGQDAASYGQLERSADVQIVMDYAADIFDGARYIGVEEDLDRDWKYIIKIVNRHGKHKMIDLNEIIEENKGPELETFEKEVEQLTQDELERLNVEEGIYTPDRAKGVHRDLLEISAAEVSWSKYFSAYRKVTGRPSALDPSQNPSKHITNFTIFDQAKLDTLIEPFAPGMSRHITPIKYEALTPDMYCLLFRTHGKDDRYYYFVLLEYDFISDLEKAKGIIAQWHGEVIEFLPPQQEAQDEAAATLEGLSYPYNKVYKGLLARVNRPTGDGYWAAHFEIKPGDDIDAALAHLPEDRQTAIKRGLARIKDGDQKRIAIYIKPEGGYEFFFYDPAR